MDAKKQNVNLIMTENTRTEKIYEWGSRILLTIHLYLSLAGYISFLEIKHQLDTPLIPKSMVNLIAAPHVYTSLTLGVAFFIALWLYFLRKKLPVIIICVLSIIAYQFLPGYFVP
jgi:hypothetical protein